MNLLEVNNICKTYGSGETAVHALKKVSFSVPKGEYVAIVGESGSGKSTLLNMIGALGQPTSGKVTIDGTKKYEQTIIMITHNRSIAQTADRVLQVSDGVLTDLGRCRE